MSTSPPVPESLDEFPKEILLEIVAYVSDRFYLSQVSKHFYGLVCEVQKSNKLNIERDGLQVLNIMDDQMFNSMKKSKRKIDEVCISRSIYSRDELERLKELLRLKVGWSIKKLEWWYIDVSLPEMMKILRLMPQLEDLALLRGGIVAKAKFEQGKLVHFIPLKSLTIHHLTNGSDKLFRSPNIPASVKCLSDFVQPNMLESVDLKMNFPIAPEAAAQFFQSQRCITRFKLSSSGQEPGTLPSWFDTHLPRLTHLDIQPLHDVDFNYVCSRFDGLKEFVVDATAVSPELLPRIIELRQLEKLWIKNVAQLEFPRSDTVIELKVDMTPFVVQVTDVVQLAESFPRLRKLEFLSASIYEVGLILQNFENLEELHIDGNGSIMSTFSNNNSGRIYPNMKKLSLRFFRGNNDDPANPADLLALVDIMPNLEKLALNMKFHAGSKNKGGEEETTRKMVEVLTQVKSKVKSFEFNLRYYARNNQLITKELGRVFEGMTAETDDKKYLIINVADKK